MVELSLGYVSMYSRSGRQWACVEPEAATGGDYSDDTLPAGNGDTQQYVYILKHILKYLFSSSAVFKFI